MSAIRQEKEKERIQSLSSACSSNKSEIHSVYKGLDDPAKEILTDKNGKELNFYQLFHLRFMQVCKDRRTVREEDLREYIKTLQYRDDRQKVSANNITSFD